MKESKQKCIEDQCKNINNSLSSNNTTKSYYIVKVLTKKSIK